MDSGGFSYQRSTIPNSAPTALALSTSTLAENSAIGTVVWRLLIVTACTIGYVAGVSTTTSESDRFLYMPSAFLCGLLGIVVPMINSRILRHGTALVLVMGSVILMKQNHANWMEASHITRLCLTELPPAPQQGTLWVYGLPDDHHGAFIFRNGFPEALALAGRPSDDVVVITADSTALPALLA